MSDKITLEFFYSVALNVRVNTCALCSADMRLRFLTIFLMVVVGVTLALAGMRYGPGVLEDDFVSQLSTTYSSSAHFMCLYGLLNFYMYTMAYVYSPAQLHPQGKQLEKKKTDRHEQVL